ncbi:MAG: hypothetical protein LBR28_02280 [Bacteroidales bacterium]|nr:hypothetical protein [Bacteroidales bacterium]
MISKKRIFHLFIFIFVSGVFFSCADEPEPTTPILTLPPAMYISNTQWLYSENVNYYYFSTFDSVMLIWDSTEGQMDTVIRRFKDSILIDYKEYNLNFIDTNLVDFNFKILSKDSVVENTTWQFKYFFNQYTRAGLITANGLGTQTYQFKIKTDTETKTRELICDDIGLFIQQPGNNKKQSSQIIFTEQ